MRSETGTVTKVDEEWMEIGILSIRSMSDDELGNRLQRAGLRLERGIPLKAPRQFVVEIEALIRGKSKASLLDLLRERLRKIGMEDCDRKLVEEMLISFVWSSFLILEYAERMHRGDLPGPTKGEIAVE